MGSVVADEEQLKPLLDGIHELKLQISKLEDLTQKTGEKPVVEIYENAQVILNDFKSTLTNTCISIGKAHKRSRKSKQSVANKNQNDIEAVTVNETPDDTRLPSGDNTETNQNSCSDEPTLVDSNVTENVETIDDSIQDNLNEVPVVNDNTDSTNMLVDQENASSNQNIASKDLTTEDCDDVNTALNTDAKDDTNNDDENNEIPAVDDVSPEADVEKDSQCNDTNSKKTNKDRADIEKTPIEEVAENGMEVDTDEDVIEKSPVVDKPKKRKVNIPKDSQKTLDDVECRMHKSKNKKLKAKMIEDGKTSNESDLEKSSKEINAEQSSNETNAEQSSDETNAEKSSDETDVENTETERSKKSRKQKNKKVASKSDSSNENSDVNKEKEGRDTDKSSGESSTVGTSEKRKKSKKHSKDSSDNDGDRVKKTRRKSRKSRDSETHSAIVSEEDKNSDDSNKKTKEGKKSKKSKKRSKSSDSDSYHQQKKTVESYDQSSNDSSNTSKITQDEKPDIKSNVKLKLVDINKLLIPHANPLKNSNAILILSDSEDEKVNLKSDVKKTSVPESRALRNRTRETKNKTKALENNVVKALEAIREKRQKNMTDHKSKVIDISSSDDGKGKIKRSSRKAKVSEKSVEIAVIDSSSDDDTSKKTKDEEKSTTTEKAKAKSSDSGTSKKSSKQKSQQENSSSSSSSDSSDTNNAKKKLIKSKSSAKKQKSKSSSDEDDYETEPKALEDLKTDPKLKWNCKVKVKKVDLNSLKESFEVQEQDKAVQKLSNINSLEISSKRKRVQRSDSSSSEVEKKKREKKDKTGDKKKTEKTDKNGGVSSSSSKGSDNEVANDFLDLIDQVNDSVTVRNEDQTDEAILDAMAKDNDGDKSAKDKSDESMVEEQTAKEDESSEKEKENGNDSDSSVAIVKTSKKAKSKKKSSEEKSGSDSEVEKSKKNKKTKAKKRRKVVISDSEDEACNKESEESEEEPSESEEEEEVAPKKKKRTRIKKLSSDEDAEDEKSTRKKLRKVWSHKSLEETTIAAGREEEERKARIAEKQKKYNNIFNPKMLEKDTVDKVVLDFDEETNEELLTVDDKLTKVLKPHQASGIQFMWNSCFESIKRVQDNFKGSGCILGHCMGLGKTLQVVTLVHTLITNSDKTGIEKVLVVCPLSTVLNWKAEFNKWLPDDEDFEVYEIASVKSNAEREYAVKHWHRNGGALILGYDMFRNLTNENNKRVPKKMRTTFQNTLVNPGPDIVICDEGHLLKNEKTSLSIAMNKLNTAKRIVLTGTPLQNNLREYYCMVQFVKPNLLGTFKEYSNRFVNPITNGQYTDSTDFDIQLMRRRSHVLHKMLDGVIQRRDYAVLAPFLPPKLEYVLFITVTDMQKQLYEYYMRNLARKNNEGSRKTSSLFCDFQALQRIGTHPRVLLEKSIEMRKKKELEFDSESEGSLKDFIDDGESSAKSTSSDDDSDGSGKSNKSKKSEEKKPVRRTRANAADFSESEDEAKNEPQEWWQKFCPDDELDNIANSGKMMLLFEILKECEVMGDKVLIFSQSLYSLNCIEYFLRKIDEATQAGDNEKMCGFTGSWSLGLDYYRLDGSMSCDSRQVDCKNFNDPNNTRARLFLISTKAGGLGINLVAANRVIIFDVSWNPSHDIQSIYRVYRFGQTKPTYVYRFVTYGAMEMKVYERQVTKQAISKRVIDEQQIDRHYNQNDLAELYNFEANPPPRPTPMVPKDVLLAELLQNHEKLLYKYHEHQSLLENKEEETLNEEERKAAWEEFENEKKARPPPQMNIMNNIPPVLIYQAVTNILRKENPTWDEVRIQNCLPIICAELTTELSQGLYTKYQRVLAEIRMIQQIEYQKQQLQQQLQQAQVLQHYQTLLANTAKRNAGQQSFVPPKPSTSTSRAMPSTTEVIDLND